jgi:hypothetical protein
MSYVIVSRNMSVPVWDKKMSSFRRQSRRCRRGGLVEARIMLATSAEHLIDASLSTRSCQSLRAIFFAIYGNIPKRRIRSKALRFGGCQSGRSNGGCRKCASLWRP